MDNEVIELSKSLFLLDYKEMLDVAVLHGMAIAGSARCCIIIKNKRGELVIKAGFPKEGHGIGEIVDIMSGEKLMHKIMFSEGFTWIDNPAKDERTQYLRPLAEKCDISAIVFAPLFCSGESLGLMVFDFTSDQKESSRRNRRKITYFAGYVATAMKNLYRQKQTNNKALRQDRLTEIGQNAAGIAHNIRNAITTIGLTADRLNRNNFDPGLRMYINIIIKESDKITKTVGDILSFARFDPENLNIGQDDINSFFVEMAKKFSRVYNFIVDFHPRSDEKIILYFDREIFEYCIHDLIRNAKEAGAECVKITATPDKDIIRIVISNDGEAIPESVVNQIFDPFVTTKSSGTGLGLANVRTIITAHGGAIKVESDETETKFSIILPFF